MAKLVGIVTSANLSEDRLDVIDKLIGRLEKHAVIIVCGSIQAEMHVQKVGRAAGFKVQVFKADWDKEPKRAGHLRNMRVANACDEIFLIGSDLGTNDVGRKARQLQKTVWQILTKPK